MPANVEIKAKIASKEKFRKMKDIACELSDSKSSNVLWQTDVFYAANQGRLKMRTVEDQIGEKHSELISYERNDEAGPKLSTYHICQVRDPVALHAVLNQSLGSKTVVSKKRTLCKVGQTRVHLDHVDKLGYFMELEVVLREGQTVQDGNDIAQRLLTALDVQEEDLLTCAYADLIDSKNAQVA